MWVKFERTWKDQKTETYYNLDKIIFIRFIKFRDKHLLLIEFGNYREVLEEDEALEVYEVLRKAMEGGKWIF